MSVKLKSQDSAATADHWHRYKNNVLPKKQTFFLQPLNVPALFFFNLRRVTIVLMDPKWLWTKTAFAHQPNPIGYSIMKNVCQGTFVTWKYTVNITKITKIYNKVTSCPLQPQIHSYLKSTSTSSSLLPQAHSYLKSTPTSNPLLPQVHSYLKSTPTSSPLRRRRR